MRLRHIEVFNAVMHTGSVSAAARLINISQPAVSRTLQHAELQLGFALFQRNKGRLTPTSEALALLPHMEKLFGQLEEVQRLADSLRKGRATDELRIASVLALSHEVLPRALAQFKHKHPNVTVSLQSLHSPQIVQALVMQEADVGFVLSNVQQPTLQQENLARAPMMCIVPKGMLPPFKLRAGSLSLDDLTGVPTISLDAQDPVGMLLNQLSRETSVGLNHFVTVQTYHTALAMAHHGLGVAVVDACTALSADQNKVDVLPLAPDLQVPVNAIRSSAQPNSLLVKAITREMQKVLAAHL